jgi:D-alanine transaminase/branched-chain amino acid aminotransferase
MTNELFVYVNDEWLPASQASLLVSDLALQRGYGVFDFCKTIHHTPIFLDEHIHRFVESAGRLRLPIRPRQEIISRIQQLMDKNNIPHSGIKLVLTGGYSPDGYTITQPNLVITQTPIEPPAMDAFEKGMRLVTYPHIRQMPEVKTIDYLMAIWLQPYIREKNADDVLYHLDGRMSECPRSNFFIVTKDDTVVTPDENILKGVIRGKVLELAQQTGSAEERPVTWEDIRHAKEAFITSTTKHIIPVLQIDGGIVGDGSPGEISRHLRGQLDRLVSSLTS